MKRYLLSHIFTSKGKGLDFDRLIADALNRLQVPHINSCCDNEVPTLILESTNVWTSDTRPIPEDNTYPFGFNTDLMAHEGWNGTDWKQAY